MRATALQWILNFYSPCTFVYPQVPSLNYSTSRRLMWHLQADIHLKPHFERRLISGCCTSWLLCWSHAVQISQRSSRVPTPNTQSLRGYGGEGVGRHVVLLWGEFHHFRFEKKKCLWKKGHYRTEVPIAIMTVIPHLKLVERSLSGKVSQCKDLYLCLHWFSVLPYYPVLKGQSHIESQKAYSCNLK